MEHNCDYDDKIIVKCKDIIPKINPKDRDKNVFVIEKKIEDFFDETYFLIRYKDDPKKLFTLKIVDFQQDLCNHHKCSLHGLSPKIKDYWKCKKSNGFSMITEFDPSYSNLNVVLNSYTNENYFVAKILLKLYYGVLYMNNILNIYHKDLYPENIIITTYPLNIQFINFINTETSKKQSQRDILLIKEWFKKEYSKKFPLIYNTIVSHISNISLSEIKKTDDIDSIISKYDKCIEMAFKNLTHSR